MNLPIPDHVWILIKEKFGSNLRYVVPGTGGEVRDGAVILFNNTGKPGYTRWEISKNINFSPTFITYDSADQTYEYQNKRYLETEFLELLKGLPNMIHVLTLTWNGLDKLQNLRPGLMKNLENTGLPFKWYIRDNGSKDGTVEEIKKWEHVEVLAIDHNRDNFAQGVNSLRIKAHQAVLDKFNMAITFTVGDDGTRVLTKNRSIGATSMAKIHNDCYLLMNNDVEFGDEVSLSKMLVLMTSDVAIVGCRLLYNGTDKLQHAGVIFSDRYGKMPYHYRHQETSDTVAEKNRKFQAVTAAVCLVRAGALDQIGGMDEKFHWAFEDIDMCLRIGALGHKIVYCGETKIYHEESASLKKNPVNKMFMGPNVDHFKSKWFGKYELDHDKYLKDPLYNEIKC